MLPGLALHKSMMATRQVNQGPRMSPAIRLPAYHKNTDNTQDEYARVESWACARGNDQSIRLSRPTAMRVTAELGGRLSFGHCCQALKSDHACRRPCLGAESGFGIELLQGRRDRGRPLGQDRWLISLEDGPAAMAAGLAACQHDHAGTARLHALLTDLPVERTSTVFCYQGCGCCRVQPCHLSLFSYC